MDVWTDLEPLRKNARVGIEQNTFGVLWMLTGGLPGRLACTMRMIQKHFQRDGSTLREHLEKLAKIALIRLIARDRRRGTFLIEVLLPLPAHEEAVPDRQMKFALTWADGVEDLDAWMKEHASELPPPPEASGPTSVEGKNSDGDFPVAARGDFPATARGDFPATARGDFPAGAKSAIPAGKPAENERGNFPAGTSPSDGNFPASPFNVNERDLSRFNGITSSNVNVNVNVDPGEDFPGATGPAAAGGEGDSAAEGDLALAIAARTAVRSGREPNPQQYGALRRIAAGKSPACSPRHGEAPASTRAAAVDGPTRMAALAPPTAVGEAVPIGMELLAAIEAKSSPARQKGELVARIRGLVQDAQAHHWIFRFAADLMLVEGRSTRSDAGAIWAKMEAFLSDLHAWREAEKRQNKTPVPLGRWLNKRVHEICAEHGILTPRDRKAARAGH